MDREISGYRKIFNSYVIDDGWNLPVEVIEVIDLRVERAWKEAYQMVCLENYLHKGDWLTLEVARKYAARADLFRELYENQYIGYVRQMGMELRDKYGVTEIEAINILNGYHIAEYVEKYDRIKNMIPLRFDPQAVCDDVLEEYGYKSAM